MISSEIEFSFNSIVKYFIEHVESFFIIVLPFYIKYGYKIPSHTGDIFILINDASKRIVFLQCTFENDLLLASN